jgi:hypothetical protein
MRDDPAMSIPAPPEVWCPNRKVAPLDAGTRTRTVMAAKAVTLTEPTAINACGVMALGEIALGGS